MYAALFVNILIVGVIALGIVLTRNPFVLMGLVMLREMPVFPPAYMLGSPTQAEPPSRPIGFTTDIDE